MEDENQTDLRASKSQLKRAAEDAQELGRALLTLTEADWTRLALPDQLVAALREAGRIRAHGALKRHLQYIGKLMRSIDTRPVAEYLATVGAGRRRSAQAHHRLEHWRDRLIDQGDTAIEALLRDYPDVDRRQLTGLVHQARAERKQGAAPKAGRVLFRFLRQAIGE